MLWASKPIRGRSRKHLTKKAPAFHTFAVGFNFVFHPVYLAKGRLEDDLCNLWSTLEGG